MYFLKYRYIYLLFILLILIIVFIILLQFKNNKLIYGDGGNKLIYGGKRLIYGGKRLIYGGKAKHRSNDKKLNSNNGKKLNSNNGKKLNSNNGKKLNSNNGNVDGSKEQDGDGSKEQDDKTNSSKDKIISIDSIQCIPVELLADMQNILKRRFETNLNFNILNEDDKKFYERQSCILAEKYNINSEIIYRQILSIRNQELSISIAHLGDKIHHLIKTVKSDFESGYDLSLIADKHKLPYIATLKQLCAEYGYSKNEIKEFLRKKTPFPEKLNKLNSEIDFILENDITSSVNNINNKKKADEFEKLVADKLDKLGIGYISEMDIREAANNEEGQITPDILFKKDQDIILNGKKINWIELKNFPYYKNKLLEKKIQQQAKKYYNKYGIGVFIFKLGVLCTCPHADGLPDVKFIGWEV